MDVCGTTLDGREALELLRAHRPDLALLDQDLPGVPTLSLLRAIARDHLASGVVVVSGNPETRQPYEAVAAGARGYLTHEAGADAITRALVMVARGEVMFAAEVQTKLFERFRERNRDSAPDALEPGTQLLLRLVAQGLEPRDIAARLDLSPAALERRLRAVCERFNVGSPTTAAFNAMEQGLLE
jgi:two-component system nitrate/nitrite response regulator NarL